LRSRKPGPHRIRYDISHALLIPRRCGLRLTKPGMGDSTREARRSCRARLRLLDDTRIGVLFDVGAAHGRLRHGRHHAPGQCSRVLLVTAWRFELRARRSVELKDRRSVVGRGGAVRALAARANRRADGMPLRAQGEARKIAAHGAAPASASSSR
jgi:hypothetical protein